MNTKVKVFHSAKRDTDLDSIDAANELLEEMKIDDLTGADQPLSFPSSAFVSFTSEVGSS